MAGERKIQLAFWTDANLVQMPLETRMVFLALWSYTDDQGVAEFVPEDFRVRMFPGDPDIDIASHVRILKERRRIAEFSIGHKRYLWVPHLLEYQKRGRLSLVFPSPPEKLVLECLGDQRAHDFFAAIKDKDRKNYKSRKAHAGMPDDQKNSPGRGKKPAHAGMPDDQKNSLQHDSHVSHDLSGTLMEKKKGCDQTGVSADSHHPHATLNGPSDPAFNAAEKLAGRPLSSKEQQDVTRWLKVEKYPATWIEEAFARAEHAGKTGKRNCISYVGGILDSFREEGAPQQRRTGPPARAPSVIVEPYKDITERDTYKTLDDVMRTA